MNNYEINLAHGDVTFYVEADTDEETMVDLLTQWFEFEQDNGDYANLFDFMRHNGVEARCNSDMTRFQEINLPHLFN